MARLLYAAVNVVAGIVSCAAVTSACVSPTPWFLVSAALGRGHVDSDGYSVLLSLGDCVKIVTLLDDFAEGTLTVSVATGNNRFEQQTDGFHERGSVLLDRCFDEIEGIQVQNTGLNGWYGRIILKIEGELSYGNCISGCTLGTSSTSTSRLFVDGNNDSFSAASALCMNARKCIIGPPTLLQPADIDLRKKDPEMNTACDDDDDDNFTDPTAWISNVAFVWFFIIIIFFLLKRCYRRRSQQRSPLQPEEHQQEHHQQQQQPELPLQPQEEDTSPIPVYVEPVMDTAPPSYEAAASTPGNASPPIFNPEYSSNPEIQFLNASVADTAPPPYPIANSYLSESSI